jgi:nicotinamidase-related amidase
MLDLQHDFLAPAGRLPIDQAQVPDLVEAVNAVGRWAVDRGWPVVRVGNHYRPRAWFRNALRHRAAIDGSPGAGWDERVATRPEDRYFKKSAPSAFTVPGFAASLLDRSVDHVIVVGVMASACVTATCADALARGYGVTVVADAVGDRTAEARARALDDLGRRGARVATRADL